MRGRRPLRVVLDSDLRTPPTAQVLCFAGSTLIVTRDADAPAARRAAARGGCPGRVECARPTKGSISRPCWPGSAELECNEVLVEAGPTLAGEFMRRGLVDELVVYMAPVVLGDAARGLFNLPQLEQHVRSLRVRLAGRRAHRRRPAG